VLSRSVARPIGCIQNCASRADCDPAGLLATGPVDPFAVRSNLNRLLIPAWSNAATNSSTPSLK
jgi:hypothetical protein